VIRCNRKIAGVVLMVVPSTGSFKTVGGSGGIAKAHAYGHFSQGEVTGSTVEQILADGAVDALAIGPGSAPRCAVCRGRAPSDVLNDQRRSEQPAQM
jgi:hypothetical protein